MEFIGMVWVRMLSSWQYPAVAALSLNLVKYSVKESFPCQSC